MGANVIDQDSIIDYLVGTVAAGYPTTTVEFVDVAFVAMRIRGVLN